MCRMGSSGNPRCAGTQVLPPLSLRITEPPAPDSRFQKPGELLASAREPLTRQGDKIARVGLCLCVRLGHAILGALPAMPGVVGAVESRGVEAVLCHQRDR